jgi:type IV pilus assembly protein PilW
MTLSSNKYAHGFTLVELMIAMLISLFLLGGVVQIFVSSKQSYRVNEDASRLQENGRFAMDIMARDIRMSGFLPCRIQPGKVANSVDSASNIYDFFNAAINADEYGASAFTGYPAVGSAAGDRIAGADAIRILRGGSESSCVESHNPASAVIQLCGPSTEFVKGDVLLVCDAEKAALFQMTGPNSAPPHSTIVHNTGVAGVSPGNCNKSLGKPTTTGDCTTNSTAQFGQDAQVVKFTSVGYFIGVSTSGTTTSLYRVILDQAPVELIEDIETMQFLYGEDTTNDGIADRYVTGDNVVDANMIVSVRIGLLVKSSNEVAANTNTKTYNVAGTSVATSGAVTHPADRRLRNVYTSTIKVRNRGIL